MNDLASSAAKTRPTPVEAPLGWLRTEIDRLFDDFGRPARSIFNFGASALAPIPALDMSEGDKEYRLTLELPGIKEDEVEIAVAEGVLTVSGEKREEEEHKDKGYLISERRYGGFRRQVSLPTDVDPAAIKAEFKKGVLTIALPKDADAGARARKIPISQG
ncbi:Hsp20/alpha crystallin family protein [Sphingomonas oligophenolica]|uniref:Hsp20/alpha crystallin family protein n=1 Tax=Sphingomonas oligophenolica TaxID=301154 RepID=A0ABU9Y8F0_9SPHN